MSDTPNSTPDRTAEQQSLRGRADAAVHRDPDQRGTERKDAALHGDQRRQRVVTHRTGVPPARDRNHREPERGNDHTGPLPSAEVKAEEALSQHPRNTSPPGSTACTTDSGASASAPR